MGGNEGCFIHIMSYVHLLQVIDLNDAQEKSAYRGDQGMQFSKWESVLLCFMQRGAFQARKSVIRSITSEIAHSVQLSMAESTSNIVQKWNGSYEAQSNSRIQQAICHISSTSNFLLRAWTAQKFLQLGFLHLEEWWNKMKLIETPFSGGKTAKVFNFLPHSH